LGHLTHIEKADLCATNNLGTNAIIARTRADPIVEMSHIQELRCRLHAKLSGPRSAASQLERKF